MNEGAAFADSLNDCMKREASLLSLNSHFLPSVAPDNSCHIYPFSLHGMKSEDNTCLQACQCACVSV